MQEGSRAGKKEKGVDSERGHVNPRRETHFILATCHKTVEVLLRVGVPGSHSGLGIHLRLNSECSLPSMAAPSSCTVANNTSFRSY